MPTTTVQTDLFGNPVYTWIKNRQENASKKHMAICQRFDVLYKEQRIRIDDVVVTLAEEFFMSKVTIEKILRKR